MSGNKRWLFRLQDMIDQIDAIFDFLEDENESSFLDNQHKCRTVERYFEILGEAAKYVPRDCRDRYSNIQWNNIIGMRNKISHDYLGIDPRVIWETYKNKLQPLKTQLQAMQEQEDT